jgi:hypothetical protein
LGGNEGGTIKSLWNFQAWSPCHSLQCGRRTQVNYELGLKNCAYEVASVTSSKKLSSYIVLPAVIRWS